MSSNINLVVWNYYTS